MGISVSVIMPSLNVVDYIDECMESALNQTLNDIELICIDAGSTDGTWDKLTDYSRRDNRVIPVHSDVRSYGYQVNMGIDMARGEYIAILETDDYIDREMYDTLYRIAVETDADYVKADFDTFETKKWNGERKFIKKKIWGNKDVKLYNEIIDPRYIRKVYAYDYYIWKGIYKRSFLVDNGIRLNESKGAAYQDIGFSQQVHAYATRAYYSDKSFYRYRLDRDGSSSNSAYGLSYARCEFERLLCDKKFRERMVCPEGLCMHMVISLCGEMPRVLRVVGFDTESEYVRPHYEWLKVKIIENESGYLEEYKELSPTLGEILDDLEGYCAGLKEEYLKKKSLLDLIHGADKGSGIVIFGAGMRGRRMLEFLLKEGLRNVMFADNNSSLWGSSVDGVNVIEPMECAQKHENVCYIIANSKNSDDIVQQLVSLGVDRRNILDDYRKIFGIAL
jgi:glycosyltransferase involved in cell wall biosynthesis